MSDSDDASDQPPDAHGGGAPVKWLETVTLEGATEPVRVVLDGREGHQVFVRQADPSDGNPPRIPLYPGDELVMMTVIAGLGHHLTSEVGRVDDYLFGQRIVPVRREPGFVVARTLRRGEVDDGSRVHLRPGEQLVFEEGGIVAELEAIDDQHRAAVTGYAPLTPVMWTWMHIAGTTDEARNRYLFAATRRLDAAARLLGQLEGLRTELQRTDLPGPAFQRAWFELIGTVELSIVALGRVVDMASKAEQLIGAAVPLPPTIVAKKSAVTEIRNAYEHIEDRALGQVRQKLDPQALTIFDHRQLVENDVIEYAGHRLDIATEVPVLLDEARQFFKDVAGNP
ncbi:hypothetical protein ACWKWC_02755 [Geodermatophilus nigrescens]